MLTYSYTINYFIEYKIIIKQQKKQSLLTKIVTVYRKSRYPP